MVTSTSKRVTLLPGLTHQCLPWVATALAVGAAIFAFTPGGPLEWREMLTDREPVVEALPPVAWLPDDTVDWSRIVENASVGITVWTAEPGLDMDRWRIAYANPAASETLGMDMQACIGKLLFDCMPELHNETGERYGDLVRAASRTKQPVSVGTTRMRFKNGMDRYYYSYLAPIDDQHVAIFFHIIYDISQGDAASGEVGLTLPPEQAVGAQLDALQKVIDRMDQKVQEIAQ